jgi:phosphoglycerate dehydrogenase-like enzyme
MNILILTKMKPSPSILTEMKEVAPEAKINQVENWKEAGKLLEDAEIIISTRGDFPQEALKLAKNLKWVHSLMVGVETFLYPEFKERGIILTNPRGAADVGVSEHTFALMLAWTRAMDKSIKNQVQRTWERTPVTHMTGKTIGIIGLGSIGREVARKAKEVFKMRVIATKRRVGEENHVDVLLQPKDVDELLTQSDYIVVAAAMTEETRKLLSVDEFKKMKPNAFVVNIARGPIIDEQALITALQEKWIAGAGLDVFEAEPLPVDSPLWDMENVIITPHMAGFSGKSLADLRIGVFNENLRHYLRGASLPTEVNQIIGY